MIFILFHFVVLVFIQDINPTSKPQPTLEKTSSYWSSPVDENDDVSEGTNDSNLHIESIGNNNEFEKQKYKNIANGSSLHDHDISNSKNENSEIEIPGFREVKIKSEILFNTNNENNNEQKYSEYNNGEKSSTRYNNDSIVTTGTERDFPIENKTDVIDNIKNKESETTNVMINNVSTKGNTINDTTINAAVTTTTATSLNSTNNNTIKKTEAIQNPSNSLSSFNGITRCAVFPVPISSFSVSIWSAIINASSTDLRIDPYGKLLLPISEFLDLTIPPVDAICNSPWPRPLVYYKKGVNADGFSHTYVNNMNHPMNMINGGTNVIPTA